MLDPVAEIFRVAVAAVRDTPRALTAALDAWVERQRDATGATPSETREHNAQPITGPGKP